MLENLDVLWAGALGTLRLFVICVVLGFGFGLVVGLGRHARSRWVHLPATAFVEFFRNTPVLVQTQQVDGQIRMVYPIAILVSRCPATRPDGTSTSLSTGQGSGPA